MHQEAVKITDWLKEKVEAAGGKGVVFGLSGGVDSAVVGALAKSAFGSNALGLILPCESQEQDEADARLIAEAMGIVVQKYDLTPAYQKFREIFADLSPSKLALANLKARLRMSALYLVANERNYLVVGTSNKSEIAVGYFTKWGDSACDLRPLAELTKTQVRELARFLGVPEKIIAKPPSAGLWPGQTDEAELGVTYAEIDAYLSGRELPEETLLRIRRLEEKSQHKRTFPPAP
ncbi:MAG: NAD(+) synthase [Firmicutes bacterium]|nr:NAD(+) synthase [Bacillota bacterium]